MMDLVFYGFAVLVFAAAILLIEGLFLWWTGTHGGEAQRISRRLRLMSGGIGPDAERVSILKQRRYSKNDSVDQLLHRIRLANSIDLLLLQSGVKWSLSQVLLASLLLMCVGLLLVQPWPVPLLAKWVIVLLFMSVPFVQLRRARTARLHKIEEQLPEAADFLARALRAGHSFTNVLQMVGAELPEPLSGEFRAVHEEINYGVPLNEALHNLADRIPLTDLRYLVIAVVIQRESGGNLAEILGNISHIIRARLKLIAQVRVLSAEGRMSAWILGLLPLVVMFLMSLTNYAYISMLWTEAAGVRLLWIGAGMILFGVFWLRRVIRIHI
jgi:tight adherence protein B